MELRGERPRRRLAPRPAAPTVPPFSPRVPIHSQKFLIDGDGMCVKRYSQFYPTIDIAADIEKLLQADEAEGVVKPTTP